jgi:hypothetical protein
MKRALLLLVLAGCGDPPPDGFTLAIRLVSIDPEVIDTMRLSFTPQMGAFTVVPDAEFEDGLITTRVEDGGEALVMEIDGEHVRAHATRPDGAQYLYELQIWSDDETTNSAPRVLGSVLRDGESIGSGQGFLPGWPPPLGSTGQLAIECSSASVDRCTP